MADSEDDSIEDRIELQVRRILSDLDAGREKAIIDSFQSQRDFLIGNTKWVVTGFFGLLLVFGALVTFIFGSQIDDKYFEAVIGESLSETIETKIEASIKAQSKESLARTQEEIQREVQEQQAAAISKIDGAVNARVDSILNEQVITKIEEASAEFIQRSTQDIFVDLIPSGAVLAFDRSDGCPSGWRDMGPDWRGRMVVAAVNSTNDPYGFGRSGGAETHTLTVSEMPRHIHGLGLIGTSGVQLHDYISSDGLIDLVWYRNGSSTFAEGTETRPNEIMTEAGSDAPHNNMPPYIALYFCKKESG